MFIRDLARRIPDEVRSLRIIIEEDPIGNAVPVAGNYHMIMLAEVWYEFVDTTGDKGYCSVCLQNVLNNYKAMKDTLVEMETNYKLLQSL